MYEFAGLLYEILEFEGELIFLYAISSNVDVFAHLQIKFDKE